jgi:hypothetical protein
VRGHDSRQKPRPALSGGKFLSGISLRTTTSFARGTERSYGAGGETSYQGVKR